MGFKLIEHILQHVFSSVKVGVLLMKIWKWYKNLSDEQFIASKNLSIEDKYPLYAFTNKKKYAKQFKKMRRMERFIEVHDNLTRAEYTEFCNNKNKQMLKMRIRTINFYTCIRTCLRYYNNSTNMYSCW